ncbi:hypothetical protein JZN58_004118 [Vibrio vulnificus]|nr:hypothetical protein [Vibrio vulnificus]
MKLLEKHMPLVADEQILNHLKGNAYNMSSNIVLRILGNIERIFSLLTGSQKTVDVIVTDNRVITIEVSKFLWIFDGTVRARSYTPRSVSQVGYALQRELLIFKSHYLEFISGSSSYLVKSKDGKTKVYEMIKSLVSLADKVKS